MSDQVINGRELAQYFGVTEARIVQLHNDNVLKRDDKKLYPLRESVRLYCEFLRGVSRGSDAAKNEQIERTRLTSVKADLAELQHAELQGELLRAEVVQKQGALLGTILRNNLESVADRIAAMVAAESDQAACHEIIDGEIQKILVEIVQAMDQTEVDDSRLDITRRTALEQLSENEGVSDELDG